MEKKEKKNKHSINWTNTFLIILTIIFAIFAIISLCFYANRMGNMRFKDIFHFWDYISSDNEDWDTFSFLLSGAIDCAFSGITLLFVIVQYYNGLKEKKEAEFEKRKEKAAHFIEKNNLEREKRREKYEHQREQEKNEKDKWTIRFIEDMEKINIELQSFYSKKNLFEIFKYYNEMFEKQIYVWIFLQDLELNGHSIFEKYNELKKQFPLVTSAFNDTIETIDWDSFKKHHNGLEKFLLRDIKFTEELKTEILNNCSENYSKTTWLQINNLTVPKVLYSTENDVLNNLLSRMIEHFLFAMRSLSGYQEGINYYFLHLSEEQRYFFRFITPDVEISRYIKDAIIKTESLKKDKKYEILRVLDKN